MVLQFEKFSAAHNEGNKTMETELLQFAGIDLENEESHYGDGFNEIQSNSDQKEDSTSSKTQSIWKHRRVYEDVLPIHRQYLTLFYKPINDMLVDLLGDEWKNIWD